MHSQATRGGPVGNGASPVGPVSAMSGPLTAAKPRVNNKVHKRLCETRTQRAHLRCQLKLSHRIVA